MTPPIRVLYAEDNPLDVELTRTRFAERAPDFELEFAGNGQQCLDRLQGAAFDLILLDHRLPDMDGLDVLRALVHRGTRVPVVLVTGSGDEDLVVKALRLGAASYVPKAGDYLEILPDLLHQVVADHRNRSGQGPILDEPRRVLYVEHQPMDIDLTLRHFGEIAPLIEVQVVRSCAEGLERLRHPETYDAAVIDLRMPDMSGLDFVREARRQGLRMPPFIISSGRGDEHAAIASLKLGAADYVTKTEGYLDDLRYAIDRAIARDRLDRVNARLQAELEERTRTERALRLQNVILSTEQETTRDGILVVDTAGRILVCNRSFAEMWGLPEVPLPGAPDEPTLAAVSEQVADVEGFRSRVQWLYGNPEEQSDDELRLKDGRVFERYSSPMRGADGSHFGRVWYFRDITVRRQAEQEVAAQLDELRRWHEASLGREGRILELKREVNELLAKAGLPRRYEAGEAGGS